MSRSDRFDRGDFEARYSRQDATSAAVSVRPSAGVAADSSSKPSGHKPRGTQVSWPIDRAQIRRVGQSVLTDRNGKGRPHKGIDIFAPTGTPVLAAQGGRILRVVDGRGGTSASQRRAGLFIDVLGRDSLVYRYLHLGEARVNSGQTVREGTVLGVVAAAHTSGLADATHLHFEIRLGDVGHDPRDYGASIDPLRLLPPVRV